jgi:hypothetical protein
MDPNISQLLEVLTSTSRTVDEQERSGLRLSLVVEKHSKQRSPARLYGEILPQKLLNLALSESEYTELVVEIGRLLTTPELSSQARGALIFALGGTDDRTIDVVIPTLARFLAESADQTNLTQALRCLETMLSSPVCVRGKSTLIRQALPDLAELGETIQGKLNSQNEKTKAMMLLQKLSQLM